MEMLVSTINIINQRLERIDVVVCEKLSKLDQQIDEKYLDEHYHVGKDT
jgi:hypothetical protein